ncbi:ExbD/TolR family protein [Undibacterium sp. Ji42W]|uniref:ExbD/TolR family protein n=1 Tax=Undibacterium sp. Ji42W TaxID=3413039 RepID=UPI003BF0DE1A
MMHAQAGQGWQREDEVLLTMDSTPMIGIMLALIAMLVMAVPPARHFLDYGASGCAFFDPNADSHFVDIDFDGSLQLNGEVLTKRQLEQRFQAFALRHDHRQFIFLRANHATTYQQVTSVLASTRRHGLDYVHIVNDGLLPS